MLAPTFRKVLAFCNWVFLLCCVSPLCSFNKAFKWRPQSVSVLELFLIHLYMESFSLHRVCVDLVLFYI